MENRVTGGTMIALACSAIMGYAAQQPPATSAPTPAPRPSKTPSAQSEPKDKDTTTVIGCVQAGATPRQFVLASSPNVNAPAGLAPTLDKATRYELIPDATTDLQKLVGKQVEVKGAVTKNLIAPHDNDGAPSRDAASRLVARSIKETGTSC